MRQKILMVLLGARGDCVYATTIAHQIKHDNPDCHLIWLIGNQCRDVLNNNPHVDEVWDVPADSHDGAARAWAGVAAEATALLSRGIVDRVYPLQIYPENFQNYDGTVRPSLFRAYGAPITVPVESHVLLDAAEERNVRNFVDKHGIADYTHRILFECRGGSGQTHMTLKHAVQAAQLALKRLPSACFIMTSDLDFVHHRKNIISGKEISFRENLALTHHCTHFVGCGSGVTALITSCREAKKLPNIQVLASYSSVFASFVHDFEHWGFDAGHFIEMHDNTPQQTAEAVAAMCSDGLAAARRRFHREPVLHFEHYCERIANRLLAPQRYIDAARSVSHTVRRYGWNSDLLQLGKFIINNIARDKSQLKQAHAQTIADFAKSVAQAVRSR